MFKASCNSPAAGGAANSGPMIAKRSRAHRSRCGRSFSSLTVAPLSDAILGVADGNEGYKALRTAAIGILCGCVATFGLLGRGARAQGRDKAQDQCQPIPQLAGIEPF